MAPLRDGRQAIEFFERWFQTNITSGRRDKYRIIVRSGNLAAAGSIGLYDQEWIGKFATSDDGLGGLVASMGGNASVYPWYITLRSSESAVGLFNAETESDKKRACPGVWVDIRGSFHTSQIIDFAEYLVLHGVPAPTLITGRDMDGSLDYFDGGRLWWRTEWSTPPTLDNNVRPTHAAWGIHIQEHAIRSGLCNGLPVNGWPTIGEALYPLPGTNGVSVLYTGEDSVPWRTIEIATDRRLDDLKTQREYFSSLSAVHPNTLWDHVLLPQGWHSRGMGAGMHEQWWSAPGSKGLMTAMTDGLTLRLYLPDWLTGLKEASDAGVVLNKWTVACILGWDGDVSAFMDHWSATGRLY